VSEQTTTKGRGDNVPKSPSILVIRRDNIGDLLLTTPMFEALRQKFPSAHLAALVNSYNRPILEGNPFLDEVYCYAKAKHVDRWSVPGVLWRRLGMLRRLRRRRFDYVILPNGGPAPRSLRPARWAAPQHIIGYVTPQSEPKSIDLPVWWTRDRALHEVEVAFRLLAPLGIEGPPPRRLQLVPNQEKVAQARASLPAEVASGSGPLVALHISSRKEQQRWPVAYFSNLARRLHLDYEARFLLFWSPGDQSNPQHPGDDKKAEELLSQMEGLPVAPMVTEELPDLISGLTLADCAVLSDGGAMHIAAALGKPLVCFFGNSGSQRWHPWGVAHQILQKESRDVSDITVDEAVAAFARLPVVSKWG